MGESSKKAKPKEEDSVVVANEDSQDSSVALQIGESAQLKNTDLMEKDTR